MKRKVKITKTTTANIVLAIGGLSGFVLAEVQNSTFVLQLSVSAKIPAHRQYANRYSQFYEDPNHDNYISYFNECLRAG